MSGEEEFGITHGKFIVAYSLYSIAPWASVIDSTYIILDVDEIDSIQIIWDGEFFEGTVYWYELNQNPTAQNYDIYSSIFTNLVEADTIVPMNTNNFNITIFVYDASVNNQYVYTSSNITKTGDNQTVFQLTDEIRHIYTFQITGDQDGWVKFVTSGPASSECSSVSSEEILIDINRSLNPTVISGDPGICSTSKNYSLSGDSQTETYTWTTTNGLKIYKDGNYITTYTGTETSLTLANPTSTDGISEIKVIAHAQGYYDSEESVKQIWLGDPDPNDLYIIGLDNYGNSIDLGDGTFEVCEDEYYTFYLAPIYNLPSSHHRYNITDVDFYFDFNYTYITGGYGWAYIRVNNIDDYSVGLIDVDACCTISQFLDYEILEGDCGYYLMSYSPNPADQFIDIKFTDEKDLKNKTNKIKIKKQNNGTEIGDYLVQILDNGGIIRKSVQSNTIKTTISTRDLEPGVYFLHITLGDEKYKQQIVIF